MITDKQLDKFRELFNEFDAKCKLEGFYPQGSLIYRPDIVDTVTPRERKVVDIIADNYLAVNIRPVLLDKQTEDDKPKKEGKKAGGVRKKD